jgi:hypothetical protein
MPPQIAGPDDDGHLDTMLANGLDQPGDPRRLARFNAELRLAGKRLAAQLEQNAMVFRCA